MNRTKRFFYNSTTSMILQIVTMIVGFIVPGVMLRAYGSSVNGLVTSINQFISYFALVEAGLAAASVYALYKPLAKKDHEEISSVVSASKKFYIQSGLIFSALVLGLSIIYPLVVKSEDLSYIQVALLVAIIGCSTALNFFALAKYRALLTADQRNYVLNILSTIQIIVNTSIIVVLTRRNVDIVLLRAIALFSVIIPPTVLYFYVKKKYPKVNYSAKPNLKAINKRWDALVLQLLGSAHTAVPILIATFFTSLEEVSVYGIFNMVVIGIQHLMSVFSTGVSSSFGELLAKKEYKTFEKAYSQYEYLSYFLLSIGLSCTMVLIMPFVGVYTAGLEDAVIYNRPLLGFLFVLNAICFGVKNPQGTLISSAGLFKETKWQSLIQTLIAAVGGIALAIPFGLEGILVARILSNVYRDIDLLIYMPKKLGYINMKKSFLRVLAMFIEIAIVCVPFIFIKLNPTSFSSWILMALIVFGGSVLFNCLCGLIFDRKDFLGLVNRGKSLLKRKNKVVLEDENKYNSCCGCGACAVACPTNAITMVSNKKGFTYPNIDKEKCNNCGLCKRICGFNKNAISKDFPNLYAVKHKDTVVRKNSTSGGGFTLLSDYVLDKCGVIYGAVYDKDFNVVHQRAETKQERDLMRGSKYVQSDMLKIFTSIENDLKANRLVLFTGTPCQVSCIKAYLKKDYDNLITVDLLCHGVPSPKLWKEFLQILSKKAKSKIVEVNFRDKSTSYFRPKITIRFANGKKIYGADSFYKIFITNKILRDSCHNCQFRSFERCSDFTLADFSGLEKFDSEFADSIGTSLMFVSTPKAKEIFENLKQNANYKLAKKEYCREDQITYPVQKNASSDKFWLDYHGKGLKKALVIHADYSKVKTFFKKANKKIKRILKVK